MSDEILSHEAFPDSQLNPDRKQVAKTKRRIEITVEKHRRIVVSGRRVSLVAWCAVCAERVRMVTPEDVAVVSGVSLRAVYRWVEARSVHFLESPVDEAVYICLRSLGTEGALVKLDRPTNS
jgi:hypothetical protein